MPKPSDPNKPKSVRRPKAPVEVPAEEELMVAEMDDQLIAICKTIPDDVREQIVKLLLVKPIAKTLTACRKFQDAATDSGAPELDRPKQRACCVHIAETFVQPEGAAPLVADDSGGEDDSYEEKPKPPPVRLTGKRILSKKHVDRACPINDIEFAEKAMALAKCEADHREQALAHKGIRARIKQEVDDSNANRARLAEVVSTRVEVRSVLVIVEIDYDMGVVREIDATTQDVLETRPIAASEMQLPLIPTEMLSEIGPASPGDAEGARAFAVVRDEEGPDAG